MNNNTASKLDRVFLPVDEIRTLVREGRKVEIQLCNIATRINGRATTTGGFAVVVGATATVRFAAGIVARFYHRAGAEAFLARLAE